MISKTNIQDRLERLRNKRISQNELLKEVESILLANDVDRESIKQRMLWKRPNETNKFEFDLLDAEKIFHLSDIKKLCVDYRLRFVDMHFFKGEVPEEAISKIRSLEKDHAIELHNLKIVAPAKLLKLENADDPLLLAPMDNDYYYLIHKWGNDLHPLRKWLMWPYKSFENLIFAIFVLSILLTGITPMGLFTKGEVADHEYLLMFLFMFKAVAGIVLFYGFAKGKNFNGAIWNSKYYNA